MADIQELVTKIGFQVNQTSVRNATNNLRNFGGMAAQIATRVVQEVDKVTKEVVQTANRAAQVGMNINQYQQLLNTIDQTGGSTAKAANSFDFLTKKIGDAKDNIGKERQDFDDVGIRIDETTTETVPEVLEQLAERFVRLNNHAQIAADGVRFFGKSGGSEMAFFLKQAQETEGSVQGLVEQSNQMNPLFTDKDIQNAKELQASIRSMYQLFKEMGQLTVIRGAVGVGNAVKALFSSSPDVLRNTDEYTRFPKPPERRNKSFSLPSSLPPLRPLEAPLRSPVQPGSGKGLNFDNTFNINVEVSGGSRGDIQDIQNATFQGTNDASNLLEEMLQNIVTGNPREE